MNQSNFLPVVEVKEIPEEELNIYQKNGYLSRKHYLECLAEDFDIEISFVEFLADINGPSEDFDGLVVSLEDWKG